ncbi:MAG: preprotein translocase subunit SecE [Gemmatimonadales bacterium]
MAADAVATTERGWAIRAWHFLHEEVPVELRKVTWPTWPELKKATWIILAFVLALGLAIGWLDVLLQFVLVKLVARMF